MNLLTCFITHFEIKYRSAGSESRFTLKVNMELKLVKCSRTSQMRCKDRNITSIYSYYIPIYKNKINHITWQSEFEVIIIVNNDIYNVKILIYFLPTKTFV